MLYVLSVVISIAAVCGVAVLTGMLIWNWAKQREKYKEEMKKHPPRLLVAQPERKYIGKRYIGPILNQETVLEYIVDFRLGDGTLQTVVVPHKVWKNIEIGKTAELLVQDEFFIDFDNLA